VISGYGIHGGRHAKVFFHHSAGPVSFLKNKVLIPAKIESVVATPRSTVLGKDNNNIAVVEHLLAALHTLNIWSGLIIEVQGDELPILDGSAIEWYEAIKDIKAASINPEPLVLKKTIRIDRNGSTLKAEPGEQILTVEVDYEHKAIGKQSWTGKHRDFHELLKARTFGFLKDAKALQAAGLATRAKMENVIIYDDVGALQELRYQNEAVRHKALDAVGDLYLLGSPLEARLEIFRGSHSAHVKFVREILREQHEKN